jgi:DNA polymerase III epsilon subunit-like protein
MGLVAFDIEHVGARSRRPLQLGLVEVIDGRVTRRLMLWVPTPGHPWTCVTTASRRMLKRGKQLTHEVYESAPFLPDVWCEIAAFVDGRRVVAHQAGGDVAALRLAFDDLGLPWPRL